MTDPGYPPEATAALAAGTQTALAQAVVEIEQYVAAGGWDAPVRVFALVGTAHVPVRAPDALRTRSHADDASVALGPTLVPVLIEALLSTFD